MLGVCTSSVGWWSSVRCQPALAQPSAEGPGGNGAQAVRHKAPPRRAMIKTVRGLGKEEKEN